MNARTTARLFGALTIALVVAALGSGCSQQATKAPSPTPVVAVTNLPSGTLPGVEFVDVESLPMGQKADVHGWEAGGNSFEEAPTLKAGYKPVIDTTGVQHAEVTTGSSNGIAIKEVTLQLNPAATKTLATYTTKNVGGSVLVVLNGHVVFEVPIKDPIVDGKVLLSGDPAATDELIAAIVPGL
jgi:hypothetical protein